MTGSFRSSILLSFDGPDDNLTAQDFGQLFSEYNLLQYAEKPALLQAQFPEPRLGLTRPFLQTAWKFDRVFKPR